MTLKQLSPIAMKIVHEAIKIGKALSTLKDCLVLEEILSLTCKRDDSDFHERIISLFIDGDSNLKWKYSKRETFHMYPYDVTFANDST